MALVKARQMGCSTAILAYYLSQCITHENTVAVVVSHEEFATQRLMEKARFMENSIPKEFKPELDHSSTHELTWPDINSTFYIGTAGAKAFGRGDTIHYAHLSEPAFYSADNAEKIFTGVGEAVPESGKIVWESSPNGRGGKFYKLYDNAKQQEGRIKTFFFPWWFDSTYEIEEGSVVVPKSYRFKFEPTDVESRLMIENSLNLNQIRWRRAKINEFKLRGREELFRQEYPENDIDCFLVSGISALPTDALMIMASNIRQPFVNEDGLRKWLQPTAGVRYLMAMDAAKGLPTSDPSVAVIINTKTCTHEATLRGKWPPDVFAAKAYDLGCKYHNALAVVEREGYGDGVIRELEKMNYARIYTHTDKKTGWPTTAKGTYNRRIMIQELAAQIRTHTLTSWDEIFINEALDFQFLDGKEQAPAEGHDDMVMAMAIAMTVMKTDEFTATTQYYPATSYTPEGVLW